MTIQRFVLAFAGTVVLLSLFLAVTVSLKFLFLTAFVGANLLQSSFTGFCPLAMILRAAGMKDGPSLQPRRVKVG